MKNMANCKQSQTYTNGIVVWAEREVIAATQRRQFCTHVHLKMLEEVMILDEQTEPSSYIGSDTLSLLHTHAAVTKQYNLVPAKGRWHSSAGKKT